MTLHWGIAAAGKISNDFVTSLRNLPPDHHKVVAVAARKLDGAKEFASKHDIKYAFEGYESLANHAEINIVYVGSLHPQHYEIAKLMLENGKHVLCEKPMCINRKQVKGLVDCARSKNLFLMEAVWTRFLPLYVKLRELLKSGFLGDVYQVNVEFGQPISHVDRLKKKEMGGGTILDLGIYPLQFTQMIFGCEPEKVFAVGHLNEEGVDASMSCVLKYPKGGTAVLATHSNVKLPNYACVTGTKGTIKIPLFWCATSLEMPDGTVEEFSLPEGGSYNFTNSAGLCYEAEECYSCIKNGLIESPIMSHDESLLLAKLEDTIRAQIGVKYPQDD